MGTCSMSVLKIDLQPMLIENYKFKSSKSRREITKLLSCIPRVIIFPHNKLNRTLSTKSPVDILRRNRNVFLVIMLVPGTINSMKTTEIGQPVIENIDRLPSKAMLCNIGPINCVVINCRLPAASFAFFPIFPAILFSLKCRFV